jgi:NAD(P)-dependent dehydrogenase (short-subunit alcohol dehydrogenase family)
MSRRVLITGSNGAIGAALATGFSQAGWDVVGVDRGERSDRGTDLEFITADLSVSGEVDRVLAQVAEGGRLDSIINNAATQINKPLVDTSDEDWDQVMATNLRASFQMIRAGAALLAATGGSVVNIASVHAVATSPNVAAYAVSKGALVALTRTAAVELAPQGIRVNAVLPGAVDTPMLRAGLDRRPHLDGAKGNLRRLIETTPLGFVATPEQIAPSVVHLADGEQSPYTTGQVLVVDGGVLAKLGSE